MIMKPLMMKTVVLALGLWGSLSPYATGQSVDQIEVEVKQHCANLPFAMPAIGVPSFPDRRVSVAEHGAVPDGHTLNTKAFAEAIESCAKAGGGTVVVPRGTWLTGPIKLESNINLHLERGALVQFSQHIADFPFIRGLDGKSKGYVVSPPIYAFKANNIAITGDGVIDGAGEVWRYVKREKQTPGQWRQLIGSGGVISHDGTEWWPSREAMEGQQYLERLERSGGQPTAEDYAKSGEYLRPDLVRLGQCRGILLDGPTFENSPRYHVHLVQSEDIIIRDIKLWCEWYAQNGDGIDLSSCRNVVVYNTTVNVGDDGICVKPGNISKGQDPGPACQNIVIADCIVYHAHGGFVIGSESFGGARNISVRNCIFAGTDVGIRFKSARGRGGLVENVFVDGIQMRAIEDEAILFDMYYGGQSPDIEATKDLTVRNSEPVTERTPRFQNFFVQNVVCNGANRAVVINGLPEMSIKNIALKNVKIESMQGIFCADADGIQVTECRIVPRTGPGITVIQSRNVTVQGGSFPAATDVFMRVLGEKSENIRLVGADVQNAGKIFETRKDVSAGAVKVEN
jgi:polygalacturonase